MLFYGGLALTAAAVVGFAVFLCGAANKKRLDRPPEQKSGKAR